MPADDDSEQLAAIDAAPCDLAPYRAYARALTAKGDPRGRLIDVQCALEVARG